MSSANQTKQPMSIYMVMLITSAILMLLACIFMGIELYRYGSPWENPGIPTSAVRSSISPSEFGLRA